MLLKAEIMPETIQEKSICISFNRIRAFEVQMGILVKISTVDMKDITDWKIPITFRLSNQFRQDIAVDLLKHDVTECFVLPLRLKVDTHRTRFGKAARFFRFQN